MHVLQQAVLPKWRSCTVPRCACSLSSSKLILQHKHAYWLPVSGSCQAGAQSSKRVTRQVAAHSAAVDEIALPIGVPSQVCDSPLPPIGRKATTLQQVEDGMWVFDQDFVSTDPSTDIRNNAFLIRMNDGTLMLTSVSISLTEEARALLKTIPEPVGHIVINAISPEHWLYLPQWLSIFPDAIVWAMPGTQAASTFYGRLNPAADSWKKMIEQCRRSDGSLADVRIVENNAQPEEFKGDVTFCQFYSRPALFGETTLHIASRYRTLIIMIDKHGVQYIYPITFEMRLKLLLAAQEHDMISAILKTASFLSGMERSTVSQTNKPVCTTDQAMTRRAIVMADLAFARKKEDVEKAAWFWKTMAELFRVDGRLGSFIFPVLLSNREKALEWRNKVLTLDFDRVLCSHFTPVVPDGKRQFEECFRHLG